MNQVSWNVGGTVDPGNPGAPATGGVPGRTDYSYLPGSDLLAGMSTARTDGAYTPVTATYTYEPQRDVKTQVLNKAGARVISQYDYRYNSVGNRTSVVNSGEAFGSQYPASSPENREGFNLYSYNSRSEVTESKRFHGVNLDDTTRPVTPEYRAYNYDPIGNRTNSAEGCDTQESGKTSTYETNGLNQYKKATTGTAEICGASATSGLANGETTFTYDADGNMTGVSDATGYTLYVFDGENRLIEVRPQTPASGQKRVTMAYDFMGRRIKKDVYVWTNPGPDPDSFSWTLSTSRTFTWDGWLMTDETATASTPNATPDTTSYVWGLDLSQTIDGAAGVGGLISMSRGSAASPEQHFYCADGNGNISALVSDTGTMSAAYEYDAYGACLRAIGPMSSINTIGFSTKPLDVESNLIIFPYRAYNASIGKFITTDPAELAGGLNPYSYTMNMPINSIDPLGFWLVTASHLWISNKTTDTLQGIVKYFNADPDDMHCLWPVNGTKDHGYMLGKVKPCDQYDVSNIAQNEGKVVKIRVSSDIIFLGGEYVKPKELPAFIKNISRAGGSPISVLIVSGHSGTGRFRNENNEIISDSVLADDHGSKQVFTVKQYENFRSDESNFENAKKRIGPKRCWFTRSAKVWFAGCKSNKFAEKFAKVALRKNAMAYGSNYFISINPITYGITFSTEVSWKKHKAYAAGQKFSSGNWRDDKVWTAYPGGI